MSIMQYELTSSGTATQQAGPSPCTLLFQPLFVGRGFEFPCDTQGLVDLDALSERARLNYFYARAMMGRELSYPRVQPRS